MQTLLEKISLLKEDNKTLFYNSSGSKQAYQLNIKHLSSAEFLGFALALPNGSLRITQSFYLVNFEDNFIKKIKVGSLLRPIKLETY